MGASLGVRLVAAMLCLGAAGCDLFLGIPNLADPDNVADMTKRFKAAAQADRPGARRIDWGPGDSGIWWHYLGPQVVIFCGRPEGETAGQYEMSFSRGALGTIEQHELSSSSHPSEGSLNRSCEH